MSNLSRLLAELCPNGVEFVKLKEVATILNGFAFKSDLYTTDIGIRVVRISDVQKGHMSDKDLKYYPFESEQEIKSYLLYENDLVMSLTGNVGRVAMLSKADLPAALNQRVACIRPTNEMVIVRFLYHYLDSDRFETEAMKYASGGGQKNMSTTWLGNYFIPVPPLVIQRKIVEILDNFTELTEKLTAELTARRKQYEYYRDELLTFGSEVSYKELTEVCDYADYRGKTPRKTDAGAFLVTAKNIRKGYIDYETSKEYVNFDEYDIIMRRGKPQVGDVLITTEAPCGHVAQLDRDDIALAQRVIKYRGKNGIVNNTFLKHILLANEFQAKLLKAATGGTVKGIKGSNLHKLAIPIPPIEEQARIAGLLDRFDALCNDITAGLPAEIAARQKQYEYYRDKLLTFKEKSA
jgi:type I restriction enzyme S subunit